MADAPVDLQKAQELMREKLAEVARATDINDKPEYFLVVMMLATSALIAEMVSTEKLFEPGTVDEMIDFAKNQLERYLREDLAGRIKHERARRN